MCGWRAHALPLTLLFKKIGQTVFSWRYRQTLHPGSAYPKVREAVCPGLHLWQARMDRMWVAPHHTQTPFLPIRADDLHPCFQTGAKFGKHQVIWVKTTSSTASQWLSTRNKRNTGKVGALALPRGDRRLKGGLRTGRTNWLRYWFSQRNPYQSGL